MDSRRIADLEHRVNDLERQVENLNVSLRVLMGENQKLLEQSGNARQLYLDVLEENAEFKRVNADLCMQLDEAFQENYELRMAAFDPEEIV